MNQGVVGSILPGAARKAGHLPVGTFDCSLGKLEGTETL
jgi:hypothetical protein